MHLIPESVCTPTLRRRGFLQYAGGGLAASLAAPGLAHAAASDTPKIAFPPANAPTEVQEKPARMPLPDAQKVGYALVGLGRLTVEQLLPAFAKTRYSKPVALVSGDRAKATTIGRQLGIAESSIYDYSTYDRLADNPAVQVIYIVLPNSMHAEFTVRGARAGKHVLCEKPMANSVAECSQMIGACEKAGRKLMVAYRSQYEPMERAIVKMVRAGKLGTLREFSAFNSQAQGDPNHWRLKRALAGGGPMPDVGIYCLNAARTISGEEPVEVMAHTYATPDDPRFREVEESVQFTLQFPGGMVANCSSSYSVHRSAAMRVMGSLGWAEMSPAFNYTGLRMRVGTVVDGHDVVSEPAIESGDQFVHEIDHMSRCVLDGTEPHTGGAEGMQDMRVVEAIYRSAREGRRVSLPVPPKTRGPDLPDDDAA